MKKCVNVSKVCICRFQLEKNNSQRHLLFITFFIYVTNFDWNTKVIAKFGLQISKVVYKLRLSRRG